MTKAMEIHATGEHRETLVVNAAQLNKSKEGQDCEIVS